MNKLKIILVDDDDSILESMGKFLSNDFELFPFSEATNALNFANHYSADVIIADYYLQDKIGLNLIQEIGEIHPTIVKVLFTGYPNEKIFMQLKENPVDLFFTKPIILHEFIEEIKKSNNKRVVQNSHIFASSDSYRYKS